MIARAALVLAVLSASVASAPAQTIVGDWVTGTNDMVRVSVSNSRFIGYFTSGPYSGKGALAVIETAPGRYSGHRLIYQGGTKRQSVKARISSGRLVLDACFSDADASACTTVETWRREVRRPPQMPPVIRDGIRKPAPPPVILRPDMHQQRIRR